MHFTKSKWTPFAGMKIRGAVHRVVLRGEVAYIEGQVLVPKGYGQDIREQQLQKKLKLTPPIVHQSVSEVGSRPSSAMDGLLSPKKGLFSDKNIDNDDEPLESYGHLIHPISKSSVHFAADFQPVQRVVSPLPFSNATRFKSDSNPNLVVQPLVQALPTAPLPLNHGLTGHNILSVDMFKKEQLKDVFDIAHDLRKSIIADRPVDHILRGKIMALIFYEASTRTSCSFAAAMQRLGGSTIHMDAVQSSVTKGETLEDSVGVMAGYADVVVLRHSQHGAMNRVAVRCRKPLINAGDGVGEHPTQALLDIFTIREEMGTVRGLTITMVGDLKHGRTVHSLARLLALYENVQLRYVSPTNLEMPDEIVRYVASKGVPQEKYQRLEDVLPETDILYMTRIQKERFASPEEYQQASGQFIVTPQLMTRAKNRMRVMHPMPRLDEISPEFDNDPRAAYFRQAENGCYVRMALLAMVMGRL